MKKVVLFVFIAVVFVSCVENGKAGVIALTSFTEEEAGENCVNGGMKVETGLDESGDGVLDEDEVQDTKYICNGEAGTDGTDGTDGEAGTDGTDGTDGDNGDDGDDGAGCWDLNENGVCDLAEEDVNEDDACTVADCQGDDGTDGEKGDPGETGSDGNDGVCAGNNPPVIDSITIGDVSYTGDPVELEISVPFSVLITASDDDVADTLFYSVSGEFSNIVDNGSGNFTFTGEKEGTFYFTAVVSDGCEIVIKTFAVKITDPVIIYSGENRNVVYSNSSNPGIFSLFDAEGTWDDIGFNIIVSNPLEATNYSFGNLLSIDGNYVEFAVSGSSNITNLSYGDEIGVNSIFGGDNYSFFSTYSDTIAPGPGSEFDNETGYAGVEFTDGSNAYYGWIQVSVTNYNNSNITGTLIDWAYNSFPNSSILAGDKGSE